MDDYKLMYEELKEATNKLLLSFIDGTHYETKNPYSRPEVRGAMSVLAEHEGLDDYLLYDPRKS